MSTNYAVCVVKELSLGKSLARHNPLTEIINLLRWGEKNNTGSGGDEAERHRTEMKQRRRPWHEEERMLRRRIKSKRREKEMCVCTRTCLFTHVRSGCMDAGTCVRDGEEYEGRGKWHYRLPWLLMQFPSLPFSPSFSCLIHNETPREAGLFTHVTSHPSARRWPARRHRSRSSYPPYRR